HRSGRSSQSIEEIHLDGVLDVLTRAVLRLLRRAAEHLVQDVREATLVSARRPPAGATGRLEAQVEPERPLLVSPTDPPPPLPARTRTPARCRPSADTRGPGRGRTPTAIQPSRTRRRGRASCRPTGRRSRGRGP